MYRKIIVGHDLHAGGADALMLGRQLAEATSAALVVAGIFPLAGLTPSFESSWIDEQETVAGQLLRIAGEAGAAAEAFPSRSPALGLHGLAEEIGADLVLVGSSRHSKLGRVLAGNVGLGLLHGAPCAVGIAPRGYAKQPCEIATVVVGFDGRDESRLALEAAVGLAKGAGATLKVVAVAPDLALVEQARAHLDDASESIGDRVPSEATLVSGDPVKELSDVVSPGAVLVLGSRGYGPLRSVLLGSVSTALMRSVPCPVVIHPRGTENAPRLVAAVGNQSAHLQVSA